VHVFVRASLCARVNQPLVGTSLVELNAFRVFDRAVTIQTCVKVIGVEPVSHKGCFEIPPKALGSRDKVRVAGEAL